MKALTFELCWYRLAAAKLLGSMCGCVASRIGPLQLRETPDPKLLGDDWLILRTRYCGICGSDVTQAGVRAGWDNPLEAIVSFPQVTGHEIVAEVEEAGRAVTRHRKGDRVAVYPWLGCVSRGLDPCPSCKAGLPQMCENFSAGKLGAGMMCGVSSVVNGGFAPYMAAHESMCFSVPEEIDTEVAALADPFSVAHHALDRAEIHDGQRVLVYGCGTIGLLQIQLLRHRYPRLQIMAIDVRESMTSHAGRFKADAVCNGEGGAVVEDVARWVGCPVHRPRWSKPWLMSGVDVIFDNVGSSSTIETSLRIVKPRGTIVVVGYETPRRFEWTPLIFKEVRLVGSNGCGMDMYDRKRAHGFDVYFELLKAGALHVRELVTDVFGLSSYRAAFAAANKQTRRDSIKVLIDPQR